MSGPQSPGLWFRPTRPITVVRTQITGAPWTVKFIDRAFPRNRPKAERREGLCDYDRSTITIYLREVEDVFLTLIHEAVHASAPYLAEYEVDRISRDLHRILTDVR